MRIFLIGFMGCGKSAVGKALAEELNYNFIDMDHKIEAQQGKSISRIFHEDGEAAFRSIETNLLTEISKQEQIIVACGGGTPCFNDNIDIMNKAGLVVYLALNKNELHKRLNSEKSNRPLISKLNELQLKEYIDSTLAERISCYTKASIQIDTSGKNIQKITEDIQRLSP